MGEILEASHEIRIYLISPICFQMLSLGTFRSYSNLGKNSREMSTLEANDRLSTATASSTCRVIILLFDGQNPLLIQMFISSSQHAPTDSTCHTSLLRAAQNY